MKTITFKFKNEPVFVELDSKGAPIWVYAYNMKMKPTIVPEELKPELQFQVKLANTN